ncbi:MAG: phosphate ABC transporter permease subunit PstC [SAR202 cluster bacterium]|nr:phosphate ABC transporter permease subunit PstC [SAR202 cluster bacterium]
MTTRVPTSPGRAPEGLAPARRHRSLARAEERVVGVVLRLAALVSVITTVAILATLVGESIGFFRTVSPWEFLTGTTWTPLFNPQKFGVLPLITGTLLVATIAGATALSVGLASAIFLSEYAPDSARRVIKPALEVLAGIPTVVYGYFALTFLTPALQVVFPDMIIFNALSAGLVMGIMIMPMVSTLSEDAMVAVPRSLRQAAYALGATRFDVATRVVVPAALPGIIASFILGLSRAVGETMIVVIAAGSTPKLTFNPLESIQAMTAYIVQISLGETPHGTLEFRTIFAVGLLLFLMTLAMNILGRWLVGRFAERYS